MDAMLVWQGDQGFLLKDEVKRWNETYSINSNGRKLDESGSTL